MFLSINFLNCSLCGRFRVMDDQFEDRLVYSSDSDDNAVEKNENIRDKGDAIEAPATSPSLQKQIDDIFDEVELRSSTLDEDEPIFSSVGKKSKKLFSSDEDSDAAAVLPDGDEETEKTVSNIVEDEERARAESTEKVPVPVRSSLWDSDSSSAADDRAKEPSEKPKKKVLKMKKKKNTKKRIVEKTDSDGDTSDATDNGKRKKDSQRDEKSSESSSDTDAEVNDSTPLPPREKGVQRVSASIE